MVQHKIVQDDKARGALQCAPDADMRRAVAHVIHDGIKRAAAMVAFQAADRADLDMPGKVWICRAQPILDIERDVEIHAEVRQQLFTVIGNARRRGIDR
jgi:hypothetical protein